MKFTKIAGIGLLMLLSQFLLFVFVIQWLFKEYNNEKEGLKKDLYRQFTDSKQQVMDSMIVLNIIDPVMKGSKGYKTHVELVEEDGLPDQILTETLIGDTFKIKNKLPVAEREAKNGKASRMITIRTNSGSEKNKLLTRGINLFIKEYADDNLGKDSITASLLPKTDTLLLKRVVAENFKKEGYAFPLSWGMHQDSGLRRHTGFYFESHLLPHSFGVSVTSYHFYLLKKIGPQSLFALILLLLSGSSFLIAYRSLKNQMRLNVLKNDFISNISHELKTPVSTVKVTIEALQNFDMKQNEEVANEYLEMATQELNRLDLLINKVLTTSSLEDKRGGVQLQKSDVKQLVEELVKSLHLRLKSQGASISVHCEEQEMEAFIDKLHIEGVVLNLIDNSLKYAKANAVIDISIMSTKEDICIRVADNGPGIPEEYFTKIFEKFFRVPNQNLHNVKGHGLGLSYAALVMEKHHGAINVMNSEQGGCLFTLTFPRNA